MALVTIEQTCDVDYDSYDPYGNDEDYEAGEILEELMYLSDWHQADGSTPELPEQTALQRGRTAR